MGRRRLVLAAGALPALALANGEAEVPLRFEGFRFERRVAVAGMTLQLNGVGLRAVAWFKGFAAALYLLQRSGQAAQVLAQPGPKRLQLRLLHDVPAEEFAKALRKGVGRNTAPEELPRLAERVERFDALVRTLGKVRNGDAVDLDLDPARGLLLSLNGKLRGEPVPGEDFYAALLRSFIGERPYDARLKAGLLGSPA